MSKIMRLQAVIGIIVLCFVQQLHSDIVTGLVHHWKFDETGNVETAFDSVGNNHASLGNFQPGDGRWVEGRIGNGLRFSQPNHFAITLNDVDEISYTVAFWIKRFSESGINPRLATPQAPVGITIADEFNQGVGIGNVRTPTSPVLGQWEHYAVTFDVFSNNVTVYKNGLISANGSFNFGGSNPARWVFAHNQDPNNGNDTFDGIMDDLRIYNRQLNATDVLELFNYPTYTSAAESYNILRGNYLGGDLPNIVDSDNSYLRFFGFPTFVPLPPVQVEFESTLPTEAPTTLTFTMEASVNAVPIVQSVELFNYNTGRYELVHIQIATPFDSQVVVQTTGNILRFVESGTGNVKARLGWNRWEIFPVLFLAVNIDQVIWTTTQ